MTGLALPVHWRLGLFYASTFCVVGIQLPFWPVWLASNGLTPAEIGLLIAVGIGAKILGAPLAGMVADRRGERRRPMIVIAFFAAAAFLLFGIAHGFWGLFAVTLIFFMLWPSAMPLAESLTVMAAREYGFDYGRVRLWGSLSFIVAAILAGQVLVSQPAGLIYWMTLGAVAVTAICCVLVPDLRTQRSLTAYSSAPALLRYRPFALMLIAAALIQGSHAVYYGFGTLHWQAAGYGEDVIGALWAEGVIAEIILFAVGAPLVVRLGPARLLIVAGVAGVVRWTATGLSDALPVLVVVQSLHAFTFGATHLAAIHLIAHTIRPSMSATAQSLYSSLVMGLGLGAPLLISGWLYASFGGAAYCAMAAIALLGALFAWRLLRLNRSPTSESDWRGRC